VWQRNAALGAQGAERGHICDHADLVVDLHEADEHGVRAQRAGQHLRRNAPGAIRRQIRHRVAFLFQVPAGIEHRAMLDAGGDDVTAAAGIAAGNAQDCKVIGLRAARGKDDF